MATQRNSEGGGGTEKEERWGGAGEDLQYIVRGMIPWYVAELGGGLSNGGKVVATFIGEVGGQ